MSEEKGKYFPKMLYKMPGPHEIHGGHFDTLIVNDAKEELAAIKENGWSLTTSEAEALAKKPAFPSKPTVGK